MNTEPSSLRSTAGSALLQVMIAMVLLSIILLGAHLQLMQTSRMVNLGAQQSNHASIANTHLEVALQRIRCGTSCGIVADSAWAATAQDSVFRRVASSGRLRTVSVTVRRNPLPITKPAPQPVTVTGNVFTQ